MINRIKRVQAHPEFSRFGARNYKSYETDRGLAWNAWLTMDGEAIATIWHHGNGGQAYIDFKDNKPLAWAALEKATNERFEPHAIVIEAILQWAGL